MGRLVNVTDRASAFMQLSASVISIIACSIMIYTIYLDQKTLKKSYHLQLVQRLLLSDIGLSLTLIVYYIMVAALDSTALTSYCDFHLSIIMYFFLCSFGWTAMLAFRFRSSHSREAGAAAPLPMWVVWAIPAVFSVIVLVTGIATKAVSKVESNSTNTNRTCTFNHDSTPGIYVDLIVYQFPLFVMILISCYLYGAGLYHLRNTPQSVLNRELQKAGGYLAVLLIVWVPNFVYSILTMFDGSDPEYNGLLDLVVFFESLQGFLNACVYVWCNQKMRNWFWKHVPLIGWCKKNVEDRKNNSFVVDKMEPQQQQQQQYYNAKNRNNKKNYNMDAEEEEEEEDEEAGDDSVTPNHKSYSNSMSSSSSGRHSGRKDTRNPMLGADNDNDDDSSVASTESQGGTKTKSILIPSKTDGKMIQSSGQQMAISYDLDNERYVRFGENQTRMISVGSVRQSFEVGSPGSEC